MAIDDFTDAYSGLSGLGTNHNDGTILSIDVSPLQKLLISLATQVEKLQADNAALKQEVANLKIDKRLEALETGLQELAETAKPTSSYGHGSTGGTFTPFPSQGADGAANGSTYGGAGNGVGGVSMGRGPGGPGGAGGAAADNSWVSFEFTGLKERLSTLERKSEALWHVREGGEELRVLVERLKTDVEGVQGTLGEAQSASRHATHMVEKLEVVNTQAQEHVAQIVARLNVLDNEDKKAATERKEATGKMEAHVNSIWDQMRHVENSLSQRLTLAETSQVSTLQEVDEQKEAANELLVRLEEGKRHTVALESKLDSFNTQVAAAISPLHTSLANVQVRLEELASRKQDADAALTINDVNAAAARAVDHADRRADNIIKSIGAMEERLEALDEAKAALADVVLSVDLEALLAAHAQQLDGHLAKQKDDIMKAVSLKADREEVIALEARQGARLGVLEAAILKGLRSISDKVAAALAEKLDLSRFSEFKVQVRAILSDVEDRLKDWSPAARGMKAPLDGSGAIGASSCLCCDSRVRSVRDLQSMGFGAADKVLCPERLPVSESLLPAITRPPDVAAYSNAKLAQRKKETAALLRQSAPHHFDTTSTAGSPITQATHTTTNTSLLSVLDPMAMMGARGDVKGKAPSPSNLSGGGAAPVRVEVETISGAIGQGRIPDMRGNLRGPTLSGKMGRQTSEGIIGWPSSPQGGAPHLDLSLDMRDGTKASPQAQPVPAAS